MYQFFTAVSTVFEVLGALFNFMVFFKCEE